MIAWFKRWGWVGAFVLFAILVIILTAGKKRPNIKAEVAAAKADAKAEKLEAKIGRDLAVKKIEEEYRDTIAKLEEDQKKEAERLRSSPRDLSKWLARVGAGKR